MVKIKKPSFFASVLTANIILFILYVFLFSRTTPAVFLRLKALDSFYTWHLKQTQLLPHFEDIVIVGIDDESYYKINLRFPWGREVITRFLNTLTRYQPRVVAFDLTFVGQSPDPAVDEHLARAMKSCRQVVLGAYFDENGLFVRPLEIFRRVARLGCLHYMPDQDGISRRAKSLMVPLAANSQEFAFSFALQTACAYFGVQPSDFLRLSGKEMRFFYPDPSDPKRSVKVVSVKNNQNPLVPYRYTTGQFTYVPFWKVVARRVSPRLFRNKIVMVGVTSPLFQDIHATPLGMMPGVVINAMETLMLLNADFLTQVGSSLWWILFRLLLVILFTTIFYQSRYLANLLTLGVAEALFYASCVIAFYRFNLVFDAFSLLLIPAAAFVTTFTFQSLNSFLENMRLQRLVVTDYLTGLYVLRYLVLRLEMELDRSRDNGQEFCLAMIDIDHFKKINDHYGHERGNEVLIALAKTLKCSVRGVDVVARYGGDEFTIIFLNAAEKDAVVTMEKIHSAVAGLRFNDPTGDFNITISCGICSSHNPAVKKSEDMLQLADKALYDAKAHGRARLSVAPWPSES